MLLETFSEGVERLRREGEEGGESVSTRSPRKLPIGTIRAAPSVFQVRSATSPEGVTDGGHVVALRRALAAKPKGVRFFDPVTVFAVGPHVYCIDGHHRLAAYRAAKVGGSVPVEWFEGGLDDAIAEAARRNQKVKLQMTQAERLEAAWRLVILRTYSKAATAAAAGVGERTVAKMRVLLRERLADGTGIPLDSYAREMRRAFASREFTDEMLAAEIDWFIEGLSKAFGKRAAQRAPVFAEALYGYGGEHLIRAIAEHGGYLTDAEDLDF